MIVVLAAGLLLIAVVLLALRPLFPPRVPAGERGHATAAADSGVPHDRAEAGACTPADTAALELAIAERRARMAAREKGRR